MRDLEVSLGSMTRRLLRVVLILSIGACQIALYGNVVRQAEYRPFSANQVRDERSASLSLARSLIPSSLSPQTYSPTRLVSDSLFRTPPRPPRPAYLGPSAPKSRQSDPFHILSVNPVNEAINADLVGSYLTQMGKIKSRAETGLTWKNQRRVGKMVRRARAMGLVSRWSDQVQKVAEKAPEK
jgi:ribosomal protein S18